MKRIDPEKIKLLRELHLLTPDQLARRLGETVTGQQIKQWEAGKIEPRFSTLLKICDIFGIPIETFTKDE